MPLSDYEKAKAANERRIAKQREKQKSPEYKAKQLAKQREAAKRQQQKRQAQLSDPEFRQKQFEQARKQQTPLKTKPPKALTAEQQEEQRQKQLQRQRQFQATQWEKQKQKLANPEYRQQQQDKQRAQQQATLERRQLRQIHQAKNKQVQPSKPRTTLKNRGMKGRGRTARERVLEDKLARLGCICCFNQGWYTTDMNNQEGQHFISMHHVDGRTKDWCHAKQLPLCHYHHDTPPPLGAPEGLFPLHGTGRKPWEEVNGTQENLLKQVYEMIDEPQPWLEAGRCIEVDD